MSSLHARLAGLTLLLLLLWGITSMEMRRRTADLMPVFELAVEHTDSAAISLTRSSDGRGPVDIRNDSTETLYISLPDNWKRDEVRHAPLSSIVGGEPSLGFRRWSFPPHATVTFIGIDVWNRLFVRNISDTPLRLRIVTVNLERGTSETDSMLIDDDVLLRFSALKR